MPPSYRKLRFFLNLDLYLFNPVMLLNHFLRHDLDIFHLGGEYLQITQSNYSSVVFGFETGFLCVATAVLELAL